MVERKPRNYVRVVSVDSAGHACFLYQCGHKESRGNLVDAYRQKEYSTEYLLPVTPVFKIFLLSPFSASEPLKLRSASITLDATHGTLGQW